MGSEQWTLGSGGRRKGDGNWSEGPAQKSKKGSGINAETAESAEFAETETDIGALSRNQLTKALTRRFLRFSIPSFLRTLETWNFAVRSLMFNWCAISLFVRCLKSSWST